MKYLRKFENHTDYEVATLDLPNVSYCVQLNEVHYNPKEYKYVDLDLPSGLLWATMNVGANSETDYGLYFAWGETTGYPDGSIKAFSWDDYKYSNNGGSTEADMTKYNSTDRLTVLLLKDDAARVNMGGSWIMPTDTDFQELINNTTNLWVTDYNGSGINGLLFTSKTDSSKTLFFPAAGQCYGGSVRYTGSDNYYWSSSLYSSNAVYGRNLFFFDNTVNTVSNHRCLGFSVRGVKLSSEKFTPVRELDAYIDRDLVINLMELYINVYNNILDTEFSLAIANRDFYYKYLKETSSSTDTKFMYLAPLNEDIGPNNWFVLYSSPSGKCFILYVNNVTNDTNYNSATIDWTKDLNHYIYE